MPATSGILQKRVTAAPDVGVGVQDWSVLRPHRYSASYMAKISQKRTNWNGQNHGLERLKMAFPKMEILDHVGHLRLNSCIDGVGIDVGDVLVDDGLEQMILEQFDIMRAPTVTAQETVHSGRMQCGLMPYMLTSKLDGS